MAGTATSNKVTVVRGSIEKQAIIESNHTQADLEALRTTVNAIITAAATNIAAVAAVTPAAAITCALIKDRSGTTITAQ